MYHEYYARAGIATRFFMNIFIPSLRVWDVISSNMVDRFIANSSYVAKRIRRYYNRNADILFPPVSVDAYIKNERKPEDFYLFFGQLAPYKRVDIAIEACVSCGRKLVAAGAGNIRALKKKYGKSGLIRFTGRVSGEEAASLYARARALLFPGIEDFGIIPVEANAAGCPVIAYRAGGALDTVRENVTGIFFDEQSPASLAGAILRFESMEMQFEGREAFTAWAGRFSKDVFMENIRRIVENRRETRYTGKDESFRF
jgi:glycosyltransferase involved in cell wall biosynthesis